MTAAFQNADPVQIGFRRPVKTAADHGGVDSSDNFLIGIRKKRDGIRKSGILETAAHAVYVRFVDCPPSEVFFLPERIFELNDIIDSVFCVWFDFYFHLFLLMHSILFLLCE